MLKILLPPVAIAEREAVENQIRAIFSRARTDLAQIRTERDRAVAALAEAEAEA